MVGDSLETHQLTIDAEQFHGNEPATVITAHPDVPSRYDADSLTEPGLGSFPTFTLMALAGSQATEMMQAMGVGAHTATQIWPKVARAYEYYLVGNQRLFMSAISEVWDEAPPLKGDTAHERATLANQALGEACQRIVGPTSEGALFYHRYGMKHTAALKKCWRYVELAREMEANDRLCSLQRLVFDQLANFVHHYESWRMGMLWRFMDDGARLEAESLRVFRDEFAVLRDLYLQGFEVACKTLRFVVAAQNVVKRGDPDDFGAEPPPDASDKRRNPPKSLAKYDVLSNADKLCYIRAVRGWSGWSGYFNQDIRNTIGHATARHELTSGRVVSDRFPAGITYLELMGAVFDIFDALTTCVHVLRSQRVLGSPDFASVQPSR